MYNKNSKGMSPFIATILIVTMALSLAVIFSNWILPVFKTQTSTISDKSDSLITCSNAKVFFERNGLTANGTLLTLSAENRGETNITDLKIYITLNDSSFLTFERPTNYNMTIKPGQKILLLNTSSINKSNVTTATIVTGTNDKCPSTQWKVDYT